VTHKYFKRNVAAGREYFYFRPPAGFPHPALRLVKLSSEETERNEQIARLLAGPSPEKQQKIRHYMRALWRAAKTRARQKNIPFSITHDNLAAMVQVQGYACALTSIPFDFDRTGRREKLRRKPFRPSVDRIEPSLGYVAGNVRVVCAAVNMALNEWGEDVLEIVAIAFLEKRKAHGNMDNTIGQLVRRFLSE
jgi:hypothetical protein